MFAKLKQKIAEEETSSDGTTSQPQSPQTRRSRTSKPKINGWSENKWEKRRLSTASLYESKESVFSELSSTPGYGRRRTSFSSRASSVTPTWAPSPCDSSNASVGSGASREEILAMLAEKTEQVARLEGKIQGMASLIKETNRTKDMLEEKLEKQQKESSRKLQDLDEEFEQRIIKIKSDHEKALKQKSQFIQYQTDATRKAAEILEKSKQLDELDQEYAKQKAELGSLQDRLDDLARERTKYEAREKQLQTKVTSIEKENTSLRDELNQTVSELTQKSLQLSRTEKSMEDTQSELASLRQSYTFYKNQTTTELHEKQVKIENIEERNGDLERRLQDCKLSGNDKYGALERERQTLEERLSEVSTLNERLERKETALTECKRMHEIETASLKDKISNLEERLASSSHLLQDKASESERMQALIQKNEQLERDLERARQNMNCTSKSADEQISNMESEINRLEDLRIQEHEEVQKKMGRLNEIEKEYSVRVDQYKQRIADLEEEKEQLQGELDSQTEELQQVSLCLEDAMTRTNELKSQIANFEQNLKDKDGMLNCVRDSKGEPSDIQYGSISSVDAVNALRKDLDSTRLRCKKSEDALLEREKTILQLRNKLKDKEDVMNRLSTRLKQYEENNRFVKNDRIYASDARDSHKVIAALRQQIKEMQRQSTEREMLQLDENELKELRQDSLRQEKELQEKEKKIKLLQSKLAELKKAFQRELKLPLPEEESGISVTPETPPSESTSRSEKERMEYLDMNFKYLKHVIFKFMCSDNKQSRQLLNVIAHMLNFTSKEQKCVQDAFEWKLPID
ncbi:golgin subfamily A member 1-like isoform X2 [Actinia tenebrosa]|uniref:Golgin subfamily A member 1-like isoform X2 n=1 Tax=Actinia tenebrosa TaxID=6105 RepID=A0A6P8IPJ3_ACTTE|nr:golgin subfamily A member 1-like isoform X2 [Actinia tenebrosa]